MSSLLDAWCSIETWQLSRPSEQVQDVARNQSPDEFRRPVILNVLSCPVISCPTDKLATHRATTEGKLEEIPLASKAYNIAPSQREVSDCYLKC